MIRLAPEGQFRANSGTGPTVWGMGQTDRGCVKTLRESGAPQNFEAYRLAEREKSQKILVPRGYRESLAVFSHSLDPKSSFSAFGCARVLSAQLLSISRRGVPPKLVLFCMSPEGAPWRKRIPVG